MDSFLSKVSDNFDISFYKNNFMSHVFQTINSSQRQPFLVTLQHPQIMNLPTLHLVFRNRDIMIVSASLLSFFHQTSQQVTMEATHPRKSKFVRWMYIHVIYIREE